MLQSVLAHHFQALKTNFLLRLILTAAFGPILLFFAAGSSARTWTMGWIFAAYAFTYTLISRLAILRKNPDLIAERAGALKKDNIERWDKALIPFIAIILPTAMTILAGLDRRFRWSPEFPLWLQAAAYIPMTLGALFSLWAVMENAYFSAVVRIQNDRGQSVVTTGPYRYVRHPGYAGALLFNLCVPVALGSLWAFLPVILNSSIILMRTSLEDRTLQRKLPGYAEYAAMTRKRIIPGIW